jgi:hypothetical protein
MPIRIRCTHCTKVLHAKESLAGTNANCPNCGSPVYVEPPSLQGSAPDAVSGTSDYRLSPVEDRLAPSQADNSMLEQESSTQPQESTSCLKCGASLGAGQEHCQNCYYHSGLQRVVDTRDDADLEATTNTGFQRYLQRKLNRGQSPESVLYLIDFFLCLLLLAISVWFSFPIYVALVAIGLYVSYRVIAQTCGLSYRGASLLWRLVLFFGRALAWKTFGGQPRLACKRRGLQFGNADLAELNNLQEHQVLDLEATGVTDAGLVSLQSCSSLEFLILRKTSVTATAVWQLQEVIPETCIWY